jgi:glutaconate CoA-transferase subunit A
MAVVRELLRSGVSDLTIVAPTAGLDVDLLVAAGRVKRLITAYVGCEGVASVGPAYKSALRDGSLEISDYDEGICAAGLKAAAQKLPFLPWRGGVGTCLPDLNPELVEFTDPISSETLLAVPAISLDVAVVVAEVADRYGNAWFGQSRYMDPLLANSADLVVVQAEEVVDNSEIRKQPERTQYWTRTVVTEARFGTHPYAGPRLVRDEAALREYAESARLLGEGNGAPFREFMRRYVESCTDHDEYLKAIGTARLAELEVTS